MPLLSIPAIYDGNEIKLLEGAPVHGRYRVLVTFLAPEGTQSGEPYQPQSIIGLKGIWQGLDLSFEEIKSAEYKGPRDEP